VSVCHQPVVGKDWLFGMDYSIAYGNFVTSNVRILPLSQTMHCKQISPRLIHRQVRKQAAVVGMLLTTLGDVAKCSQHYTDDRRLFLALGVEVYNATGVKPC